MLSLMLLAFLLADPAVDAATHEFEALRAEPNVPRTPGRCAALEGAVKQVLETAKLTGEVTDACIVRFMAVGEHPVAVLAKKLDAKQVRLVFDADYLIENPYAAASFDREERTLRVPLKFVIEPTVDDPVLEHELVHVAIWAAAQVDDKTLVAYLRGDPFKPNDLGLDEMRAYAEDLARAARELKKTCGKASPQAWPAIYENRQKGEPRMDGLSGCDALFDRAVSKVVFGKNHTEPALPALEALTHVAMASEVSGDHPETILRSTATIGDAAVPFELHLVTLAAKKTAKDDATYVKALLGQAKAHQVLWQKCGETLEKLTHATAKNLSSTLDTLVKRAKPPTATPVLK